MTSELFTIEGKRKYLTAEEQGRFMAAANGEAFKKGIILYVKPRQNTETCSIGSDQSNVWAVQRLFLK